MPELIAPKKSLSVKKRARQNIKRRLYNRNIESGMKTQVKKINEAVKSNDKELVEATLRETVKVISKAATKGVLHKKTASRKISRLSKLADKVLKAEAAV